MFIARLFSMPSMVCALLAGCIAAAQAQSSEKVLLVAIGGNSECIGDMGIRKLHDSGVLAGDLARVLGVAKNRIASKYYSWTGDDAEHPGCLPGTLDWVRGGSRLIRQDWAELTKAQGRKIVIVGWSNGGATAYELACDLTKLGHPVSLLVTLDPVSWTTPPCRNRESKALRPAQTWIGVYTRSNGLSSLKFGNIIALLGRAWNDRMPYIAAERARPLMKLEPASHGDTCEMWKWCVMRSSTLTRWAERGVAVGYESTCKRPDANTVAAKQCSR